MSKSTLVFILVFGFFSRYHAEASTISHTETNVHVLVKRHIEDTEKLTEEIGERIHKALSSVQDSSNKSESIRISYILKQVDEDISQHKLISKIATVNNAIIRVQLIAINLGYDLLTPPGESELELDKRITAVALVKMYMDLAMVEVTDRIMANASFIASENILENRTSDDVLRDLKNETRKRSSQRKLLDEWFRVITAIIEHEPKIKREFDRRTDEAKREMNTSPLIRLEHESGDQLKAEVLESRLFRQATLNKQFLKLAFHSNNRAEFLFARAVYQLARKCSTKERINAVFQQGLDEISATRSSHDTYAILKEKLFLTITKLIADDTELNIELNRAIYALDVRFTYEKMRDAFAPF